MHYLLIKKEVIMVTNAGTIGQLEVIQANEPAGLIADQVLSSFFG